MMINRTVRFANTKGKDIVLVGDHLDKLVRLTPSSTTAENLLLGKGTRSKVRLGKLIDTPLPVEPPVNPM